MKPRCPCAVLLFVALTAFARPAAADQSQPSPAPSAAPSAAPAPAPSAIPAASAAPTAPSAAPAVPAASPTASSPPTPSPWTNYDRYALLTPLAFSHVTSEFTPGTTAFGPFNVDAAAEVKIWKAVAMMGFDFRQLSYNHGAGQVATVTGGTTFVPALTVTEYEYAFRGGIAVVPHTYIGINSVFIPNNYGSAEVNGYEFGIERLPDFTRPISLHGKFYYTGNLFNEDDFITRTGQIVAVSYTNTEYEFGAVYAMPQRPLIFDLGYRGTSRTIRTNAPANVTENGPYVSLGIRI